MYTALRHSCFICSPPPSLSHGYQLQQVQEELERCKELVVTYEQTIARKDHIIASLTRGLQKQVRVSFPGVGHCECVVYLGMRQLGFVLVPFPGTSPPPPYECVEHLGMRQLLVSFPSTPPCECMEYLGM